MSCEHHFIFMKGVPVSKKVGNLCPSVNLYLVFQSTPIESVIQQRQSNSSESQTNDSTRFTVLLVSQT